MASEQGLLSKSLQGAIVPRNRGVDRPLVLIRTTLLRGNFGGVLQAYALQCAVRDLGYEPMTDVSFAANTARRRISRVLSPLRNRLPGSPWTLGECLDIVRRDLDVFVAQSIRTTAVFGLGSRPRRRALHEVHACIVGSDQVWRPNPDIRSYLLDFLPAGSVARRIAYAASFGVGHLSPSQEAAMRALGPLARRFDAVSVRETSGVDLCRDLWGVNAEHVLDPVLLFGGEHYRDLVRPTARERKLGGGLLVFMLDGSAEKDRLVGRLSRSWGSRPFSVVPSEPSSRGEFRANPRRWDRPSMPEWLSSFLECEVVATDSFHGVVMAILFEKPFVVVTNSDRGAARVDSLLGMVGLGDRQLRADDADELPAPDVDWSMVRLALRGSRIRSWSFLQNALNGSRPAKATRSADI